MNWKMIFIQKRNPRHPFVLILLILFINLTARSQADSTNKISLRTEIQKILKTHSRMKKNMGLAVFDLHSRQYDLVHNEDKLFIPASLSKIITAGAVLHFLNPYHQFETSFLSTASIDKNGVLDGPLYLKGEGDPAFVSESLWILINHLTRSGLKTVKGPLIVDDSLFSKTQPRKEWLKSDRSYSAPVSALSFNWNSVNVYIRPADAKGAPAQVLIDPQNTYIKVINKTRTQGRKNKIQVQRKLAGPGRDIIEVNGSIPLRSKEMVIYKNITQPALWTGFNAVSFLQQRSITVEGRVVKGQTPSQARPLAVHKGPFVFRMIQDMMKFSSNFLADMLTLQTALSQEPKKDLWKQGLNKIHQYIQEQGVKDYVFLSPSGLSRKNKLKPKDILQFLIQDYHSSYSFEKLTAYPLPKSPGTLKERFKNLENSSLIRAKTGLLSGVAGLAGYIRNKKGRMKAFVFIYNGSSRKQMKAQEIFDQLASLFTRHSIE